MKKLLMILMAAFIIIMSVGSLVSCGPAEPEGPVTLRVATPWPPGDPPTERIKEMAARFNDRAGGKCTIEVHPGESLVKTQESMDAVRTGAVELAGFPIGVFTSLDPRFAAAEVPFMYNGAEADGAAQEYLIPMYNEFMPDKFNQRYMGTFICLPLELIGVKPVKTLADWKGLLVHAVSPVASQVIEKMGASPVPAPFVEGYTVLEKGVVDASMISPQFSATFKVYEVAKYETLGYLVPASLCVAINMDTWNSLPKDMQDLLTEEGLNFHRSANEAFIGHYTTSNEVLVDNGVEIYNVPKEERDKWHELVWPVSEKSLADMGDFGTRVMKVAEEVNAKFPY